VAAEQGVPASVGCGVAGSALPEISPRLRRLVAGQRSQRARRSQRRERRLRVVVVRALGELFQERLYFSLDLDDRFGLGQLDLQSFVLGTQPGDLTG
jgi:hypothetical protein